MGAPPFPWTEELEIEICDFVATHALSIKHCCQMNAHWPEVNLVYERIHKNPTFGEMYLAAKQSQTLILNDETLNVLDEVKKNPELALWGKEAIKQYNWQAGRLKPRIFGDKVFAEVKNISHEDSLAELK